MITSPYNFVPLSKYIYTPSWADSVSQDIPFADGEDGYIEVKWRNDSPLFIRDTSEFLNEKEKNIHSMHVMQQDGSRLYFIPSSSLKGMLRSVLNILSFGKMEQYNDRFFGHREFDTKNSNDNVYKSKMEKVKFGWLRKSGEDFILRKCVGRMEKVKTTDLTSLYKTFGRCKEPSAWKRNDALCKDSGEYFPKYEKEGVAYRIFAVGYFSNVKHELLIPEETEGTVTLDNDTVQKFLNVYDPSPDFEKFVDILERGKEIPVAYVPGKHSKDGIEAVGLGRMIRYPYKYGIKQLVEKVQPKMVSKDLCETIFGWISDKENSMKGRVQISNAYAEHGVFDSELETVSGVLGTPKASYYPLYIKQNGSQYCTYKDDNAEIAGRKRYRIHKGSSVMPLTQGNGENKNVMTTLMPVPTGNIFTMRVNIYNLLPVEIGALLSAITLHKQEKVWHNIGSAKSFGYGKLKYLSLSLHGLAKSEDDYLAEFEQIMQEEIYKHTGGNWLTSPQVQMLVSIMSEHDDSEMKMMELKEYQNSLRNVSFLHEKSRNVITVMSDELIETRKKDKEEKQKKEREKTFLQTHQSDYDKVTQLSLDDNIDNLRQAITILNILISKRKLDQLDIIEEDKLQTIEKRIEGLLQQQKQNTVLADILYEKYSDGKNIGNYKVIELKVCVQKVKKYIKDRQIETLQNVDKDALKQTLLRIKQNPTKKEIKTLSDRNNKLWKEIESILSIEDVVNIFWLAK